MSPGGHAFFFFFYTYNTMRLKNSLKKLVPSKKVAIGLVIGIALLVAMYMMMRPQKKEHLKKPCVIGDPRLNYEYLTRVETSPGQGDWHCPDGYIDTGCGWDHGAYYAKKQCRKRLPIAPGSPKPCRQGDPMSNFYWTKTSGGWINPKTGKATGVQTCPKNTTDTGCSLLNNAMPMSIQKDANERRMNQCKISIYNWMKLYPNLFVIKEGKVYLEDPWRLREKWGVPVNMVKMIEKLRNERGIRTAPSFSTDADTGARVDLPTGNQYWPLKEFMLRLLDLKSDGVTPVADEDKLDVERQWAHWLKYDKRGSKPQYTKSASGDTYVITGWEKQEGDPGYIPPAPQVNYNNPSGSSFGMGRL